MALVILFFLSVFISGLVLIVTQRLFKQKRSPRMNGLLLLSGVVICFAFSVLSECVIRAGRPTFYYHTHPGRATLKLFSAACLSGAAFFALFLMIAERKKQQKTILRWFIRSLLIGICGAIVLEIGYFNFRHFELIGSKAQQLTYAGDRIYCAGMYFNRAAWKFIPYHWNNKPEFFVYAQYSKVRNMTIDFGADSPLEMVEVKFDDRAHRRQESIGEHHFIPEIPRSYSIPLHTVGVTNLLSMVLLDDENVWKDGVTLDRIVLNQIVPLELDPIRFFLCFLVLFLLAEFFPGSPLWQLPLDFHNFLQNAAFSGLILSVILFFVWTVFSSYTGSGQPVTEQKAALTENYAQYNKLIDALVSRRYALLETPHHYLEKDGDPYDMRLREERKYDYPWDTAYYQGKYYVYFGVVPAIAVLLPYNLLTGKYLDLDYPILVFSILFLLGIYGIYSKIVKRCFSDISFAVYWIGMLILFTSLNLTWCLRRTLVYEMAITSGICFAVWGIFFMLLTMESGRWKSICCFLSGACSALAVGCRPTMLFVSLPVLTLGFFAWRSDSKNIRIRNLVLFLLPIVLVGFALMKYNYERFEDPFEFGITYQLTTENRAAGLPLLGPWGRILSVLSSLFTFPKIDMEFPFIHPHQPELPYNGVIQNSDALVGVFAYPVMSFLLLLPVIQGKMRERSTVLMHFCISCLIAAAAICVTASAFAITNRYLTDYLFLTALPALFTLLCIWQSFVSAGWQCAGAGIMLACAAAGTAIFVCLALTGEANWFRQINPLYFEKLHYAFSPWL